MSELGQEPLAEKEDVAGLKRRTMSDLEKELLDMQTVYKEELSHKDQVIENEMRQLNGTLAKELSAVRKDLANGLENIKKLLERPGHDVAELSNMRKEFADGFVSLSNLVEHNKQQAILQAVSTDIVDVDAVIEPPLETGAIEINEAVEVGVIADENNDDAAFEVSIGSDLNALIRRLEEANKKTVSYYKKKLRDKDQVIESLKTDLQALNESIAVKNECLNQLQEQLKTDKLDISDLTMLIESQNLELCDARARIKEKDEEVIILNNLLELADRKLDERLEQMKKMEKMATNVEQLTQLIADVKRNETSQIEVVHTVVESMQTTLSSWTEFRDHIKQISTRKANEEPIVMTSDLPGDIFEHASYEMCQQ